MHTHDSTEQTGRRFSNHAERTTLLERHPALAYELVLCLLCLIGFCGVCLPIVSQGRAPIYVTDELPQIINGIIFVGQTLRRAVRSLLAGQGFVVDQFIFTLGYGVDISAICNIRDPLNWLAVFVPTRMTEYFYYVLTYLRIVLTASTFSLYCRNKGNNWGPTMVGALCYAFSGMPIFLGLLRHTSFMSAPYLLPLVLYGADRLFEENKPLPFILAIALSFQIHPYLSYMISVTTVVYCFIKYVFGTTNRSLRGFAQTVLKFLGAGVLGVALTAFWSLPYIIGVVSVDRVNVKTEVPMFYQLRAYLQFFARAIGATTLQDTEVSYVGMVPVLCMMPLVLFGREYDKLERRPWLVGILAIVVASSFPVFGSIMNGFSYVTNRWHFVLGFVASYAACLGVPKLVKMSRLRKVAMGTCCLVYVALILLPLLYIETHRMTTRLGAAMFLLAGLVVISVAQLDDRRTTCTALIAIALLNVALTSFNITAAAPLGGEYVSVMTRKLGSVADFYSGENPYNAIDQLPAEEIASYRYSMPNTALGNRTNESLNRQRNGMTVYTSLYNQPIDTLRDSLGITDYSFANTYVGNNSRFALDALAGAKYFMVKDGEKWRLPATYTDTGLSANGFHVYATEYALPAAIVYDAVIPRSLYDELSMVERQEALLMGCVLDDEDVAADDHVLTKSDLNLSSKAVPVTVEPSENIEISGNTIVVKKSGSKATLRFRGVADAETYVCFDNLQYEEPERVVTELPEDATLKQRIMHGSRSHVLSYKITVTSEKGSRNISPSTRYFLKYCGKHDWALNIGHNDEPLNELTLTFDTRGTYTFDSFEVVCQPIEPIKAKLKALQEQSKTQTTKSANCIKTQATASGDGSHVVISNAFSSGWSARVDGEKAKPVAGDLGFICLRMGGAGEHDIELHYTMPGLRIGAAGSIAAIVALVVLGILLKRKSSSGALEE